MDLDKDRCLSNIYLLAKQKGIRIGDLETSCGVSVGYLARFRQDKKQSLPGAEFLYRAAALLETSVDALLNYDYRLATDTEKTLLSFMDKLILDTRKEKLIWHADPACFPAAYLSEDPGHPLLRVDQGRQYYFSPFHPAVRNLVPRAAWSAVITVDTDVLLVCVAQDFGEKEENGIWDELELYLYNRNGKSLSPLCHTNKYSPGVLDSDMLELFESVETMYQRKALDRRAMSAIDAYMNRADRKE